MTNAITYINYNIPYYVRAGQQYNISITARNDGDSTWTDEGGFRLGESNSLGILYQQNIPWSVGRLKLPAGTKVAPGETGVFSGTITAPTDNKATECLWRALQESVEAFGPVTGIGPIDNEGVLVSAESPYTLSPPRARGGDGSQIINTGPYKMGPYSNSVELRCYEWIPSRALQLTGCAIWMGVSPLEAQADIDVVLLTAGGTVLSAYPQDFYVKFSSPHLPYVPLPDIILEAGEPVLLVYFSKPIVPSAGPNWASHHAAFIWFKEVTTDAGLPPPVVARALIEKPALELPYAIKNLFARHG